MKTLYLDIFSGISGDMFIGALIDLGVDARKLERELGKLKLGGYHLHVARKQKSGIEGVKFDVHLSGGHEHGHHKHEHGHSHSHEHEHAHDHERTFVEIKKLIQSSKLSPWTKQKAVAVFWRIAEAEGKIHGLPPERVHFHEVGAVDSIVDIVGACIALEMLGKPRVLASPVIEGVGWMNCAHGRFPIPAPATLAILGARGVGVTQCDEPHELVTPTGAALLAEFVEAFRPMTGLVAEKIGFGLGSRDNATRPNVVRAVLGEVSGAKNQVSDGKSGLPKMAANIPHPISNLDWESDIVAVLETNLDDINSEILGNFVEKAFAAGALDVFHTAIQMKKNRPGVLLTVLCAETDADRFSEMILRETTAFGVRRHLGERRKLRREFKPVKTKFGEVTVKLGKLNGKVIQAAPEFDSCKKIADREKVPLKKIYAETGRKLNG
ncbi:MAG TPA: nickel pincer cofactor biosynthesis protein LarC [Verrucomicrobiae bacterium]|nr:nickel pincer cofactor biosynthesis protein LarC [Verrucomicrobiae bacterium]